MPLTNAEINQRCRDKKKGLFIQPIPPRRGFKQTPEHIAKRIQTGEQCYNWLGDKVSIRAGRCRAERLYPSKPCELCGKVKTDRHHKDGNTANNNRENIMFLCRKCHINLDGRLVKQAKTRNKAIGERCHTCKITTQQVITIRNDKRTARELSGIYGVSESTVYSIKQRKSWKWLE